MRAYEALSYEPAACWRRLQAAKHEFFFEDLDQLMKERHGQFLEALMGYERQCFINAHPYQRSEQRVDQANGFYARQLTTRLGVVELKVPRTRSGHFHPQVLVRYQRLFHEGIGHALERDGAALRAVFPLSAPVRAIPQVAESCALSFIAGVRLILVMTAISGRNQRTIFLISPGWSAPTSRTRQSGYSDLLKIRLAPAEIFLVQPARLRQAFGAPMTVNGRPMSLLKLLSALRT